jgi:hypothetical protein
MEARAKEGTPTSDFLAHSLFTSHFSLLTFSRLTRSSLLLRAPCRNLSRRIPREVLKLLPPRL